MAKRKRNWIKKAIKRPGALRRSLGARKGKRIPAGRLRSAAKRGGTMGRRARLAVTLRKLGRHKRRR
jgi:hypothetical protein